VADTEILTVIAALGHRDLPAGVEQTWVSRPDVPPPDECPRRMWGTDNAGSIMSRLEIRLANARAWDDTDGNPMPGGRSALWARVPDMLDLSSGAGLAILGDYIPFGIRQALGRPGGGNSLDNTLRVYELVPTTWVLIDIRIHAVANGFGHGVVHLWGEDATLLATASQSAIVRLL
jgi:acyl-CoA thioesterase